jgi:gamma-glutamyltranspeptidase/glutathione hydrolase
MFHSIRATRDCYNPGTPWGCSDTDDDAPEIPTGAVRPGTPGAGGAEGRHEARSFMVVAANPLATKAGCEVLKKGGSAVDAAIAVQMVLNLVEPQSSGIGGGAFMLHYNAATGTVTAYDGRETAPAAATENYLRWISDTADHTQAQRPRQRPLDRHARRAAHAGRCATRTAAS